MRRFGHTFWNSNMHYYIQKMVFAHHSKHLFAFYTHQTKFRQKELIFYCKRSKNCDATFIMHVLCVTYTGAVQRQVKNNAYRFVWINIVAIVRLGNCTMFFCLLLMYTSSSLTPFPLPLSLRVQYMPCRFLSVAISCHVSSPP